MGGWFDWLILFLILMGIVVVIGYVLFGVMWLVLKIEGNLCE